MCIGDAYGWSVISGGRGAGRFLLDRGGDVHAPVGVVVVSQCCLDVGYFCFLVIDVGDVIISTAGKCAYDRPFVY